MVSYQKVVVVAAFLTLFALSGCTEEVVKTRAEGVTLAFDNNYLPDSVKSNSLFDISIYLTNAGSYSIVPGELTVKLFGGSYSLSGQTWTNLESIRGADTNEELGDLFSVEGFKDVKFTGVTIAGTEVPFTVGASVCYVYKTNASALLCLAAENDPAPFCNLLPEKLKITSIAPVVVTRVTQQSYSDSIDILINVANSGEGKVYDLKDSDCSSPKNEDIVTLEKFEVNGIDYTKSPNIACEQTIRLSEFTETSFKCTVPKEAGMATKERSANIILAYKYSNSITKTVYASA